LNTLEVGVYVFVSHTVSTIIIDASVLVELIVCENDCDWDWDWELVSEILRDSVGDVVLDTVAD
jgi:hypothetical protein